MSPQTAQSNVSFLRPSLPGDDLVELGVVGVFGECIEYFCSSILKLMEYYIELISNDSAMSKYKMMQNFFDMLTA